MILLRAPLRSGFAHTEVWVDRIFGVAWNPLRHLGALGFFMYWIVAATGIYVYIFFDTGITEAYDSVEYMTHDQWYLAGVMRSLHRYASDAMVLFMLVHMLREFSLGRYRGPRWFTWVTGVPVFVFVIMAGISGYWLVWDRLAQYVALATTEWFDWLPIFGEPTARNFLSPDSLDDRFFSLMIFIHIAVPLFLLFILWVHLQRVSRPSINPARGLAIGSFAMLLVLSLVKPAVSQGPADLTTVVAVVGLDWFYLGLYPLVDYWSSGTVWGVVLLLGLILVVLPWMPPMRRVPAAVVNLAHCNGCTRCVEDCPFAAVIMAPRSDGAPFRREAVVDPNLCVSCGICFGACPSSTPFRRTGALATGIELPHFTIGALTKDIAAAGAKLEGPARVMVIGCDNGVALRGLANSSVATIGLPCIGMLPPAFIDFVLSRGHADGVLLTGCAEGGCFNRFGQSWTEARVGRTRDPYLRRRVPRDRLVQCWAGRAEPGKLARALADFRARLEAMPPEDRSPASGPPPAPKAVPKAALERTGSNG